MSDIRTTDRYIIIFESVGVATTQNVGLFLRFFASFVEQLLGYRDIFLLDLRKLTCKRRLNFLRPNTNLFDFQVLFKRKTGETNCFLSVVKGKAGLGKTEDSLVSVERHIEQHRLGERNLSTLIFDSLGRHIFEESLVLLIEGFERLSHFHFHNGSADRTLAEFSEYFGIESVVVSIHITHERHRVGERSFVFLEELSQPTDLRRLVSTND